MKVCLAIVVCSFLAFGKSIPRTGAGVYTAGGSYGAGYLKPQPIYRTYSHKQLNIVLAAAQSYYTPSYNAYGK